MRLMHRLVGSSLIIAGVFGATSARADISKCIDEAGRISYSDRACANGVVIGHMDVSPTAPPTTSLTEIAPEASGLPASRGVPRSPMALDNLPVRETAWASMAFAPRQNSTDAATIGAARAALAATDRGLAAIRTQKVAANR